MQPTSKIELQRCGKISLEKLLASLLKRMEAVATAKDGHTMFWLLYLVVEASV